MLGELDRLGDVEAVMRITRRLHLSDEMVTERQTHLGTRPGAAVSDLGAWFA